MSIARKIMKASEQHLKGIEIAKITIIFVLILFCLWVSYYYHVVLHSNLLVTHFFYLPVVFAGFWWGRRSLWIAVFLCGYLLSLHAFLHVGVSITLDFQRIGILLVVSVIVSELRETSLKTERTLRESEKTSLNRD